LSGGWDCTVFVWDIRQTKPAASFFGPCISGDSIDYKNNIILTGSYREKNSLELWDMRNYEKLCDINTKTRTGNQINYVSTCHFSALKGEQKSYIIAGSSMSNVVGLYSKDLVYDLDLEI
jgi:COMPASS component SWD3